MERTEVLDMMSGLKLYGMRSAYDETLAMAIKRKHEPQRFDCCAASRHRFWIACHHLFQVYVRRALAAGKEAESVPASENTQKSPLGIRHQCRANTPVVHVLASRLDSRLRR